MKLASIERVLAIVPIPGADRVESARVLGFSTVVKKGEFKPGDFCVWHNPDTVVNVDNPAYAFLSKTKGRLKTCRIRGVVSQGLALPLRSGALCEAVVNGLLETEEYSKVCQCGDAREGSHHDNHDFSPMAPTIEGLDVSSAVGIKKYEKPEPRLPGANLRGDSKPSNWPQFLQRTDETNIQSYPALLADFLKVDGACELVKKYDGSSATYYDTPEKQGVCSRNQELEDGSSIWWTIAKKYAVLEKLRGTGLAIQGEIVGPGVQQNPLALKELAFFVFDIYDVAGSYYWTRSQVELFCAGCGFPIAEKVATIRLGRFVSADDVPDQYPKRMPEALEELLALADGAEYRPGVPCEGLVLRPVNPVESRHGSRNRLSAKVMSRNYVEA